MVLDGLQHGQEVNNMSFFETTSSFAETDLRIVSNVRDTYVRLGTCVLTRQFDPNTIVTGSWNELWLGFRLRLSSSYDYISQSAAGTAINPIVGDSDFEFGFCKTAGSIYGESSASNLSLQHTFGLHKGDLGGNNTFWQLTTSGSGPYTMATCGVYASHRRSGSVTTSGNLPASKAFRTFVNTSYFSASYRSIIVLKITTGSAGPDSFQMSVLYPNSSNSSSISTDISQSVLADIMGASTWAKATSTGSLYGYISADDGTNFTISQSSNGYFDGIYFSWRRLYDNIEISDVVVRKAA